MPNRTLLLASSAVAFRPDPSTLSGKVLFGYQAWQDTEGSCESLKIDEDWCHSPKYWNHWMNPTADGTWDQTYPAATNVHPDMWPDMSEYPEEAMHPTPGFHDRRTGEEKKLYSALSPGVRDVHFRWMQEYGIDGVFLQRFVQNVQCKKGDTSAKECAKHDYIANTTAASAEKYERVWGMMYDISGGDADIFNITMNDWEHLDEDLEITKTPGYLHHEGKPVISVWGFGFSDRPDQREEALYFINWLKARGMYVIGGVPTYWRTEEADSQAGWLPVYKALDCINPWLAGRFRSIEEFDTGICNETERGVPKGRCPGAPMFKEDKAYTDAAGLDYAPVVFPGFSWTNMHHNTTSLVPPAPRFSYAEEGVFNVIPRMGGRFWRHQADWWATNQSEPLFIYGAMFDEVDEGTAMYKMAATKADTPLEGRFLHLSIDGEDLPSDHYLSLAGNFTADWRRWRAEKASLVV